MSKETFDPLTEYDPTPISRGDLAAVAAGVGMIGSMIVGLADADLEAGRGRLGPRRCCLWRKDGRRIEIDLPPDGGVIASASKEPDPDYPGQRITITDKADTAN
jgi:hypothetical protein